MRLLYTQLFSAKRSVASRLNRLHKCYEPVKAPYVGVCPSSSGFTSCRRTFRDNLRRLHNHHALHQCFVAATTAAADPHVQQQQQILMYSLHSLRRRRDHIQALLAGMSYDSGFRFVCTADTLMHTIARPLLLIFHARRPAASILQPITP